MIRLRALPIVLLACAGSATAADDDKAFKRTDELYVGLFGDSMIKADDKHRPPLERNSMSIDARFGLHPDAHLGYELRAFYGKLKVRDSSRGDGNRSVEIGQPLTLSADSHAFHVFDADGLALRRRTPGNLQSARRQAA